MKSKNRDTPGRRILTAETTNRRNGYFDKTIKTSMGETEIELPRDRQSSFESVILPKHKRDIWL